MRILKILSLVVVLTAIVVAFVAPIGPLPGFFIGGDPTPAPASWPDTASVHEIKLAVPGTLPHVVTIWVVDHQGELHVVGSRESSWVKTIGDGAPVEMRLGDSTYALNAVPVTEGWQAVLEAYLAKYEPDYPEIVAGFPTIDQARDTVGVFRLRRD